MVNIEKINKTTFFKPKKSHTMIKDTFEDIYNKIDLINEELEKLVKVNKVETKI